MIEKMDLEYTKTPTEYGIVEKLNEVIDYLNDRAILDETDHPGVAEAAKKATRTGSHSDLKAYLALRRRYL